MKCTAHFYKLNYDFSPEFADTHHNGKESENNRKYDWEDELAITNDVEDIQVQENSNYTLVGEQNGEQFSEEIPNVTLFKIKAKDGQDVTMACSDSIVHEYKIEKSDNNIILKVFLNEGEPLTNPIAGIYIAIEDFPKHLID